MHNINPISHPLGRVHKIPENMAVLGVENVGRRKVWGTEQIFRGTR